MAASQDIPLPYRLIIFAMMAAFCIYAPIRYKDKNWGYSSRWKMLPLAFAFALVAVLLMLIWHALSK
jgi:hypothetical protein